ncbi:hypothetical protein QUA71_26610 [Microcoleus sp. MON1_C5]|uniref:hypothetical protein n=1 Tax=Microcoleus sp. MON1_C5 TaxID=2818828 RepID=UPI002FCFDA9C
MSYSSILNGPIRGPRWGHGIESDELQDLKLGQRCGLIFWLFDDPPELFRRHARIELPGQNGGLIWEIADDNFVSPTFVHYYGGNEEAADRQTDLTSNFELKAICVPGRHIRYYALDGDSLGH